MMLSKFNNYTLANNKYGHFINIQYPYEEMQSQSLFIEGRKEDIASRITALVDQFKNKKEVMLSGFETNNCIITGNGIYVSNLLEYKLIASIPFSIQVDNTIVQILGHCHSKMVH